MATTDTLRDVAQRAEDAAYTVVGVGVLGFQQAQVRRRAAQTRLAAATRDAREQAASLTGDARAAVETFGAEVKGRVEPVVTRLAERIDPLVTDVRSRVEPVLEQLGTNARRVVAATSPGATASDSEPSRTPDGSSSTPRS
jgi:hypothetical protein